MGLLGLGLGVFGLTRLTKDQLNTADQIASVVGATAAVVSVLMAGYGVVLARRPEPGSDESSGTASGGDESGGPAGGVRQDVRARQANVAGRDVHIHSGGTWVFVVATAVVVIALVAEIWAGQRPSRGPSDSDGTASSPAVSAAPPGLPTPSASVTRQPKQATSSPRRATATGTAVRIEVHDKMHYDFDQQTESSNGGPDYEVRLLSPAFWHTELQENIWGKARIAVIDDADASVASCERGALPWSPDGKAHLDWLKDLDKSLCISTSAGKWAVLKLVSQDDTSVYRFDLRMFAP